MPRGLQALPAALALLLTAVLLVACGEGGSTAAPEPTEPMTAKAFTQEVERICQIAIREREPGFDYINEHGYPEGAAERKLIETVMLPPVKEAVQKIERLDSPEGEERVTRLMAMFRKGIAQIEDRPSMLLDGSALSTADYWAQEWGLTGCGQV